MALRYLQLERSEGTDGVCTLDAMASTDAAHHAAALAEARQVLDWAWQQHPHSHGPVEEGGHWDHALQVHQEAGGWQVVSLTISGRSEVIDALLARWGEPER